MLKLSDKDPVESYAIEFNFSTMLSSIQVASCECSVFFGDDDAPEDVLNGLAQIATSSASVLQRVRDGKDGTIYKIKCVATGRASGGGEETYTLSAFLPVVVS